jgi:hypothetical protein
MQLIFHLILRCLDWSRTLAPFYGLRAIEPEAAMALPDLTSTNLPAMSTVRVVIYSLQGLDDHQALLFDRRFRRAISLIRALMKEDGASPSGADEERVAADSGAHESSSSQSYGAATSQAYANKVRRSRRRPLQVRRVASSASQNHHLPLIHRATRGLSCLATLPMGCDTVTEEGFAGRTSQNQCGELNIAPNTGIQCCYGRIGAST